MKKVWLPVFQSHLKVNEDKTLAQDLKDMRNI